MMSRVLYDCFFYKMIRKIKEIWRASFLRKFYNTHYTQALGNFVQTRNLRVSGTSTWEFCTNAQLARLWPK